MDTLLRLHVSDDTTTALITRADALRRPLELVAQQLLSWAAKVLPAQGRAVVLTGAELETLEAVLGGGSALNAGDLVQKVERLAGVSFLHARLPFTPNQLEALTEKAARNGLTVQQLVDRTAPRIYEQFFDLIERSR